MSEDGHHNRLDRRSYIKASGGIITLAAFAGCSGQSGDNGSGGSSGNSGNQNSNAPTVIPGEDDPVNLGDFSVPAKNVLPRSDIPNAENRHIGTMPFFAQPQGTAPNQYLAAQRFAENMAKLGVEVPLQTMTLNTIFSNAYTRRQPKNNEWWYWSMWEFSPRITRLDPDEFLYNHHSDRQNGYNWMYWENEKYDNLVEQQRRATDKKERQRLVYECERLLHEQGPVNMLVFPEIQVPYNSRKWKGMVPIEGLGVANQLSFSNAVPKTDDTELILTETTGSTFKQITPWGFGNELDIRQNRMMYERLLWPKKNGTDFQNRLATNIEYENDTTIIIDIQEGHKWSDGSEVLAEDVKFTYDVHSGTYSTSYNEGGFTTNYNGPFSAVDNVKVNGDYQLTVNLNQPFAPIKMALFVRVPIAQKNHWEKILESARFRNNSAVLGDYNPESYVTSGPMEFDYWDKDTTEVRLTKNEDHYDPIQYSARVTTSASGAQQALGQLQSGEVDMITSYTGESEALSQLAEQNDDITVQSTLSVTMDWQSFNCDHPPNNIQEFRRASFHCWDPEEILQNIYNGEGQTGRKHPISPALDYWYNDNLSQYVTGLQAAANELVRGGFVWDEENSDLYMPEDRWCLTQEEARHATEFGEGYSRELVMCSGNNSSGNNSSGNNSSGNNSSGNNS